MGSQETPDALSFAVHDIERVTHGSPILGTQCKEVGTVLDVGHRDSGGRPDDDMDPSNLDPECAEVRVIAPPDEARTKDSQVPPAPLGELQPDRRRTDFARGGQRFVNSNQAWAPDGAKPAGQPWLASGLRIREAAIASGLVMRKPSIMIAR